MIKDNDWTTPHYGVTHMVKNRIQYSISNRDLFAELMVYSWISYCVISEQLFFVRPLGENCIEGKDRYWNCGDIETAIAWAKHFAEYGCYEMSLYRNDLSRCVCIERTEHQENVMRRV